MLAIKKVSSSQCWVVMISVWQCMIKLAMCIIQLNLDANDEHT